MTQIKRDTKLNHGETAGTQYSDITTGEVNYGMEKFHAQQGHGFAAERAEHLHDYLEGKDAKILGDDNALNGADRSVYGRLIQSKYCSSGANCVSACFENGHFRYYTPSGKPMRIEVPQDMYNDAVAAMQRRIEAGEVKGVTDPKVASRIIKKGNFTYAQAKAIAQSGTIESLKFDAVNGAIIATKAMSLSAVISFAMSIWNGDDPGIALRKSVVTGLKIYGTTLLTNIFAGQLTRLGVTAELSGGTDFLVKAMGPKVSSYLVNGLKTGDNIYGTAAMKNASKLLRSNILTSAITIVILSSVDIANIFEGKISTGQFVKNVATTAGGVVTGVAGWVGGATAGSMIGSVVPVIGTAVGATVGAVVGGLAGTSAGASGTKAVLDNFIEDDVKRCLRILTNELRKIMDDTFITQHEAEILADNIQDDITVSTLQEMQASGDSAGWADNFIKEKLDDILSCREFIELPTDEQLLGGLREVLGDLVDGKCPIPMTQGTGNALVSAQQQVLTRYNIDKRQIGKIMAPVARMNRVQVKGENVLRDMRHSEGDFKSTHKAMKDDRQQLKNELNELLNKK